MKLLRPTVAVCAMTVSLICVAQTATPPARAKATAKPAAAPRAGELIERARALLQSGDATQALAAAQEAQRRDASDYRAAYYIAYALMSLNDLDGAARAQAKAQSLAKTDDQRSLVQALGEAIGGRRDLSEADAALAEGLHAKAARLYAAAFDAGVPKPEAGLKAAELYEKRLGDLGVAARLLNAVAQRFANTPAGTTAQGELTRLKPALAQRARERHQAAMREPAGSREALLREVLALDPSHQDAQVAMLAESVHRNDWPEFERRAKQLQKADQLENALAGGGVPIDRWVDDKRFTTLLADMWGEPKARLLFTPDLAGEWRVDYLDSTNCRYEGTLTINPAAGDGTHSGQMRLTTCSKNAVTQDALVSVDGADVKIKFSNPRSSRGSYSADNYFLKRLSYMQMKGHNRDAGGAGGQGTLTKIR